MNIERPPVTFKRTGRSRSRAYAEIQAGTFPKPVKLGPRAIGFISEEVDAWIAARVAERDAV